MHDGREVSRDIDDEAGQGWLFPKGPKYLYGTKYGFCSSNFPYGLGKYSLYWYLGPFGYWIIRTTVLGFTVTNYK